MKETQNTDKIIETTVTVEKPTEQANVICGSFKTLANPLTLDLS